MSSLDFDMETYLVFPLFALGAATTLGLVSADFLPWFDLGAEVLSLGSISWTAGRLLSIGALVAVLVNRDDPLDFDAWGAVEIWTFYVTVGLIIAPPFFPAFAETIAEGPAAFASFTVQSIGFALITYIN